MDRYSGKFDRHTDKHRKNKDRRDRTNTKNKTNSKIIDTEPKCDYCQSSPIIGECMCDHKYCSQECANKLHNK